MTNSTENANLCGLKRENFQTTINGKKTDLYILRNRKGFEVAITNYGGAICAIMVPDKEGKVGNVIQGHDNIQSVINSPEPFLSTLIGRFGNRICKGQFTLNGKDYQLAINNGPNALHGGPTGKADQSFSAETAYFCSLGYAYVRLNYRGSAGYGRTYLESLNGHWGEYDAADAAALAGYLAKNGLADPGRMLITGGSSGGFTVLNTLVHYPEAYTAGASLYGVSDLFGLARSTWKLELHYTESLTGVLPEAEEDYYKWSPLYHAEEIRVPLAVFQGDSDAVVPKEQSEGLLSRLQVPHVFRLYEGEGHGFRKPEHIKDYLLTLHAFLQQYL